MIERRLLPAHTFVGKRHHEVDQLILGRLAGSRPVRRARMGKCGAVSVY
ncbi:MAG: hypothetical protein WC695_11700 [Candidatus Omnitrophota bacterium]